MKKKLRLLYFLPALLIGMMFSSCEKNYYTEDASANWDIMFFTVDAYGGQEKGKWVWNGDYNRYECVFNIDGHYANVDEFIYNNGTPIGYVFKGKRYVDETQTQLPFFDEEYRADLWCDTSIQGSDRNFDVCFYFKWADGSRRTPPESNFKLALVWGKI